MDVRWMCHCGTTQGPSTEHRNTCHRRRTFMRRLVLQLFWLVCLEFAKFTAVCRYVWAPSQWRTPLF